MIYTFRSSEELKARSIILKNFTTVVKLLFLLNAANDFSARFTTDVIISKYLLSFSNNTLIHF